jgi:EAL domain-containing protein (putative c-di-GMP-specific phosphodiesterase class I)
MESKLRVLLVENPKVDRRLEASLPQLDVLLRDAITRHELTVHYQPQYEVDGGRGCGVEALARWTLPGGESISPSVFIPLAESAGLICALGAWVLQHACETACSWLDLTGRPTSLSVNVSTLQINEEFGAIIERIIEVTGFPGSRLELEITESAMISDTDRAIDCMEQWKELGVQIAVDDFGTGYSSLSYLSRLPVDRLKLDKSFVHRMPFEKKTAAIVRSVLALGRDMGIAVLAEGIETERQFDMLERLGCLQVQGYLFAKPAPEKEAYALLAMPWGTRLMPVFRPERAVNRGLHAA